MTDQNVKFKTSTAPPISDKSEGKGDSYKNGGAEEPKLGSGSSLYKPGNVKTRGWKSVTSGGKPKGAVVPGFPDESGDYIGGIADWATDVRGRRTAQGASHQSTFAPKNAMDLYRMQYEATDYTEYADLRDSIPAIPAFADLYSQVQDYDYLKNFYTNRRGLINDLLKHTEFQLSEDGDTPRDAHNLHARQKFRTDLLRAIAFIDRQIVKTVENENKEKMKLEALEALEEAESEEIPE
jgi:hypothetical protein